jgi:hypothetical protein
MRDRTLYLLTGLLFLAAFAFDLPDVALHGWLYLLVGLSCLAVAWYRPVRASGRE